MLGDARLVSTRKTTVILFTVALSVGAFLFVSTASAALEISDGTVKALYHLEDTDDSSLNGYNLTNNGTTTFATGRLINAADGGTNNTSKYLQVMNDLGFTGTSEIGIAAWVYANDTTNEVAVQVQDNTSDVIIGIEKSSGGGFGIYGIRNRANVAYDWINAFDSSYTTGTWYHVVMNYKNNIMSMYGNGSFVASSSVSSNGGSGSNPDSTNVLVYNGAGGPAAQWSGLVDEVVILNREFTPTEIAALYNGGSGQEVCVTDGCDGSAPTSTSAYFDGNDAWAWSASNVAFNSTDPFTIELWYRTTSTDAMQLLNTRGGAASYDQNGFSIWKDSGREGVPYFSLYCGDDTTAYNMRLGGGQKKNSAEAAGYWHHIAVTKQGTVSSTDAFKVYFDSTQQVGSGCFNSTGTDNVWIGGRPGSTYPTNPSSSVKMFNGYIDEVRIWNVARSYSDLTTYANQEVSSTSSGLVGYWRFNNTSTNLATGNTTSSQSGVPMFSTKTPFGHFLSGYSSVVNSSTMKYNASTTYLVHVQAGVNTWNASTSGAISITSSTYASSSLYITDANVADPDTAGQYCNVSQYAITGCSLFEEACPAQDTVFLNVYVLNDLTSAKKQHTTAHELGHALGLGHSIFGNMMYPYVTAQTALGERDVMDYDYLYP